MARAPAHAQWWAATLLRPRWKVLGPGGSVRFFLEIFPLVSSNMAVEDTLFMDIKKGPQVANQMCLEGP